MLPQRPAAYAPHAGDQHGLVAAAAERGWPAPVIYAPGRRTDAGATVGLDELELAVSRSRHDALLMPLPGTLDNAAPLLRLLLACTRHGVCVCFVPAGSPRPPG